MLRALGQIGGAASVSTVSRLQSPHFPQCIRAAASETAPIVRERAERAQDMARLLRPVSSPGLPQDVLLRPIESAPLGDIGTLVRPAEHDGNDQQGT